MNKLALNHISYIFDVTCSYIECAKKAEEVAKYVLNKALDACEFGGLGGHHRREHATAAAGLELSAAESHRAVPRHNTELHLLQGCLQDFGAPARYFV